MKKIKKISLGVASILTISALPIVVITSCGKKTTQNTHSRKQNIELTVKNAINKIGDISSFAPFKAQDVELNSSLKKIFKEKRTNNLKIMTSYNIDYGDYSMIQITANLKMEGSVNSTINERSALLSLIALYGNELTRIIQNQVTDLPILISFNIIDWNNKKTTGLFGPGFNGTKLVVAVDSTETTNIFSKDDIEKNQFIIKEI